MRKLLLRSHSFTSYIISQSPDWKFICSLLLLFYYLSQPVEQNWPLILYCGNWCILEKKWHYLYKHINKTRDFPLVMKGLTKSVQRMNTGWGPFNLSRKLLQDLGMVQYSCVYVPVLSFFVPSEQNPDTWEKNVC